MISMKNTLLVKVTERWNDKIQVEGGHVIYIDVSYSPKHHISIEGEVSAIPKVVSPKPKKESKSHTYAEGIVPEIKIGDRAYFHFNTICEENLVLIKGVEHYKVGYENVFCVKRDEELIMIGGWCLVEEIIEGEDYGSLINPHKEQSKYEGVLRHIGTPRGTKNLPHYFDGVVVEIKPGDRVFFREFSRFENQIDGKKYFCMRQEDIWAFMGNEEVPSDLAHSLLA